MILILWDVANRINPSIYSIAFYDTRLQFWENAVLKVENKMLQWPLIMKYGVFTPGGCKEIVVEKLKFG